MATTNVVNSTLLRVYRNTTGSTYVAVGHATDAQFTLTHTPRPITSKDSQGWAQFLEGLRGGSFSTTAFYTEDHAEGYDEWLTRLTGSGRGAATIQFTTNVSGDQLITASVWIESLEKNAPGSEESATFTVSGVITGEPTIASVSA